MTVATLVAIFQSIGSIVGILITLITFFGLVSKRPRAAFRKVIKEEAEAANEPVTTELNHIKGELTTINERLNNSDQTDVAIIRNTLTHIYFKYKDKKKIPHYEKENFMSLYERYIKLKGNSYVKTIAKEVQSWEEIIER